MKTSPYKTISWHYLTALSTLAVGIALVGCGGGGGGGAPSTPDNTAPDVIATPLPGATPTPLPVGNCTSRTYTPNYAEEIDLLLRWPGFPLRIFFVRDGNYSQARQSLTVAGFNQWVQATNGRASYQIVANATQADITVKFDDFTSGDTLGITTVTYRGTTIIKAEVEVYFTGRNATDQITAAHEFGHALGITDHTSNDDDMMNPFGNIRGCGCVTTRDLNTLLTAYCNNFTTRMVPRNLEQLGPEKTLVIRDNQLGGE